MRRNARWGRLILVAAFVAVLSAYFFGGWSRYLDFDALNANKDWLIAQVAAHPIGSSLALGLLYVTATAFSLPIATALSVASGFLLGRWAGTLLVDISATLGAVLAFLAARYLLRDWVQARFAGRGLDGLNRSLARSGLYYLLFLRFIPLVPFFLINLGAGLTALPLRTFALGTLVGILPGAFLYVNAGYALSTISRPRDVLSAPVLTALLLLSLFSLVPVLWRWRRGPRSNPSRSQGPAPGDVKRYKF